VQVHHHDHVCEEYFQSVIDDMGTFFGWIGVAGLAVTIATTAVASPVVATVGIVLGVVGVLGFFYSEFMLSPVRDECRMAVGFDAQTIGELAESIVVTDPSVGLYGIGETPTDVSTVAKELREFLQGDSIMFPDELRDYVSQGVDHADGMGKLNRIASGTADQGDWEVAMYYVIEGAMQAAFQSYNPPPPPM
jgi:hypothetical protein